MRFGRWAYRAPTSSERSLASLPRICTVAGQVTADLTVHNLGHTSAAPFDVKFYLSDDAIIDPATDILLSLSPSDPNYDSLEPAAYHVMGGLAGFCEPFGHDSV